MKPSKIIAMTLVVAGLSFAGWIGFAGQNSTFPSVEIKPEGNNATTIEIAIPGLETETKLVDGESWKVVKLPGEPAINGEVGLPQLPVVIRNLALPDDAALDISVVEVEFEKISGVLVYPTQKPLAEGEQPTWQVNWNFYQQDVVYPKELARVKLQSSWRGLPFATVEINPVRYNPVRRELIVAKRLRVKINHPGVFRRKVVEPWTLNVLKTIVDNPERLNLDVRWCDNPGVRYLVIAHSNYLNSWLDSLVNWHQKRGIETRVIAKSSWTTTEIKDSIRAEYNRNNPPVLRWVLLVGEYNEVPGYAYTGVGFSDMWYADLNPPSGDDYFELGIGRFSPSSVTDLDNQIQKTLRFEKNPAPGDWTGKAGLAAHSERYPEKYSACTRGIYNFPYPLYRYNFDTIMGGAGGTNAMVVADINEGRVVINYRGHGSETDWSSWDAQGQSWTATHINALSNGDMTPVVINCCCLNHVLSTTTCLGEAWMRKYPGGAVASLGATEASYTIPNHAWDSTLFRCIGDTFTIIIPGVRNYTCPTWDLGWMLCNADAYIQKYYASQGGTDNARMYLWLGDPAVTVWTGPLTAANVVHPPTVPLGNYDLEVNVTKGGTPVKDALVCAWKPGEFYVYGYTDVYGNVTLPICATTPGNFSLVASGQGFPPYEGTVLARSSGAPYVTHRRSVVNDSPPGGNGDGIVNPGEMITLPTWVKNWGDVEANSVTGKIRTSDPYVNIVDSVKFFGNIPAGDSAFTGVNGFKFEVAPGCTNAHRIRFDLICQDANDSVWQSRFYLQVGTPSVRYAGLTVVDTISGGNRNGRLDPQETALLLVSLHNMGYGNAYDVRATLRSGDARLLVTDSVSFYGAIMAESIRTNTEDAFQVTTLSMPPETRISCTLYVTAQGDYSTVIPFSLLVGEIRACDPVPDTGGAVIAYWAYDDVDTFYTKHPVFNWVEIRNVGTRLTLSDDQTVQVNIPPSFGPFVFYNQSYNQISVCSNGWVAPGYTSVTTWSNTSLPNTSMPPLLAANWDDLYPPTGNGVWYYHDTANHRFIIEWDSVHYYDPRQQWDKFEVILYDSTVSNGDCEFEFQYLTSNYNTSCTVGEQDFTFSRWIQLVYNGSYHRGAAPLTAGKAILFTPDGPQVGVSEYEFTGSRIPTRLAIGVAPNPLTKVGSIRWQMPVKAMIQLTVYDATGRAIRTLAKGEVAPGHYQAVWDGTDDNGKEIANGVYVFRLDTDAGTVTTKAVLLR